ASVARHVTFRPAASGRTSLTSILWSGSGQAKFWHQFIIPCTDVTQHAPYFKGTAVGKYLVLFFYPLDFFFSETDDKAKEFHDVNFEVVAVSVDSHFSHLAWINTPRKNGGLGHMNIAPLSDLTKRISRDYGVLLEGPGLALRRLFIIDPNGVIKHFVNDLPVGRSVEETLLLVETHGKVCPVNWTQDSTTIKPNPAASKQYFQKVNQ
uniref:Thioredoxin-dependent peroxide reductase, mitochondrial n=1 Tax=Nomascus leucogenys TaxID=61853 RepID=A0A2I3HZ35_NOMLE